MAGFLLAVIFNLVIVGPALGAVVPQLVQSQADLSIVRGIQFGLLLVSVGFGAAIRAGFQGTLLEMRVRLGVAWVAASVLAALAGFLLIAAVVQLLGSRSTLVLPALDGFSALSPVPGLFAGIAGWLVLRRARRAPVLLIALPAAAVATSYVQAEIAGWYGVDSTAASYLLQALASGIVFGAIEGVILAWILAGRPKLPAGPAEEPAVTVPV